MVARGHLQRLPPPKARMYLITRLNYISKKSRFFRMNKTLIQNMFNKTYL